MAAEMNDVSMTIEVTSVKTTPTQRPSRVNSVGRRGDLGTADCKENQGGESKRTSRLGTKRTNLEIDRQDQERAKHRDENETNKAKIETKKGSEK